MLPLPSYEAIAAYERLGIVGILLFMLFLSLMGLIYTSRQQKETIKTLQAIPLALLKVADRIEGLEHKHDHLHHRMDTVFACGVPDCPAKPQLSLALTPHPKH